MALARIDSLFVLRWSWCGDWSPGRAPISATLQFPSGACEGEAGVRPVTPQSHGVRCLVAECSDVHTSCWLFIRSRDESPNML